jgi:hypothetical protein
MTDAAPTPRLLALLDDDAPAAPLIELSSALARHLGRPLEVVYVESAAALLAAALPGSRVLAAGAAQWRPLATDEVERAFRSRAARLQALLDRLAGQPALEVCALRVVRGALQQAAFDLQPRSDLMLVRGIEGVAGIGRPGAVARSGSTRPAAPPGRRPAGDDAAASAGRRGRLVAVVADESAAGRQARQVAGLVARALEVRLIEQRAGDAPKLAFDALHCELLVLPRSRAGPALIARLRQPALLVG